jgi:signal transduction histidine kinase
MAEPKIRSARVRILSWVLVPLVAFISVLLFVVSSLLLSQNRNEIDEHLTREAQELRLLAVEGVNPATGAGFESARALLGLYISRTIPNEHESMFVLVDGSVVAKAADNQGLYPERDEALVALAAEVTQVTFGSATTDLGHARFVSVPVNSHVDSGHLVAVIYSDLYSQPLQLLLMQLAFYSLLSLGAVAVLAWFVSGQVLAPIRSLRETVQYATAGDLDRRITTDQSDSELGQLANEFNSMLDRINETFANQRMFIDAAGHELRTPLTIIQGHFELFRADPSNNADSAEVVAEELRRMTRLTQELQSLTKAGDPNYLNLAPVSTEEIAEYLDSVALSDRASALELKVASGEVRVDKQKLIQVLLQLLENARKYAGPAAAVRVSFEFIDSQLEISVEDSGPGIKPEDAERIFEPFYRAKSAHGQEGSGLGLALARAIIRAHGGDIEVMSSDLGGARFRVRLPRY